MAVYFFDSSALVKRYVQETGSAWVIGLTEKQAQNPIYIAGIAAVEIIAAMARRMRGRTLTPADAAQSLTNFRYELAHMYEQQGDRAAARQTMQRAQEHFRTLAAHPFVHRTEQWLQHHPASSPTVRIGSAKLLSHPEVESDAMLRLLTAPANARLPRSKATQTFALTPRQGTALCLTITHAPASLANLRRLLKATEVSLELSALRAKETRYAEYEQQDERTEIPLPGMLYQSRVMRQLALAIHQVQTRTAAVLITGESGTGKELVARALHALSPRSQQPFIPVHCASTSKELLDDQLFGHKRGAFTGASEAYSGWIRAAEGGTLFLDEVAELSRRAQPKLLRFLQEGEIQPLGETHPLKTDVRVVAATNADLEALIRTGKFREDLYFRLNIIHLHVPPLRDRREEIVPLARHFLAQASSAHQTEPYEFAPTTLDALTTYSWPGNVRQLKNEMERVCARLSPDAVISPDDLSAEVRLPILPSPSTSNGGGLHAQLAARERNCKTCEELFITARNCCRHCLKSVLFSTQPRPLM